MKKLMIGWALALWSMVCAPVWAQSCSMLSSEPSIIGGASRCFEDFDNLVPGSYRFSFEYQARIFDGPIPPEFGTFFPDRVLGLSFVYSSLGLPSTRTNLFDSTATPGWNTFSFISQANGQANMSFELFDFYRVAYYVGLQNIQVAAVPEPSTWAMWLMGLGVMALVVWRQRRRD